MGHPVAVPLDDTVHAILEDAAAERGVELSTYLRELATTEARRVRQARTRAQSQRVAEHVASSPQAQAFYEDWGTPTANR